MNSFINKARAKDVEDNVVILDNNLVNNADAAYGIFAMRMMSWNYQDTTFQKKILDLKKASSLEEYLALFDDATKNIFKNIWENPKFEDIIEVIARKAVKRISRSAASKLYENIYLAEYELPFGLNVFEADVFNPDYLKRLPIASLKDYKSLLDQASLFCLNPPSEDLIATLGEPLDVALNKRKQLYNVVVAPMDLPTQSFHLSHNTKYGLFYCPFTPHTYTENLLPYSKKSINLYDGTDAISPANDAIYQNAISEIHEAFKNANDNTLWDITVGSFDVLNLMKALEGSAKVCARAVTEKHIIPFELILTDVGGNKHSFLLSNFDTMHLLSCIAKTSDSNVLELKASSTLNDVIVYSDITVKDFNDKDIKPFVYLKAFSSDSAAFDSYLSVDMAQFKVIASVREKRRAVKLSTDFGTMLESILKQAKVRIEKKPEQLEGEAVAEVEAVITDEELDAMAKEYSPSFYESFLIKCNQYLDTYTVLGRVENKDGTTRAVRMPVTDHYKKDEQGKYITANGEKIIDYEYVYSVREAFWINNENFDIEKLIAFFVAKEDSVAYRRLSKEILGVDCYLYEDNLIDNLIIKGWLCIEDLKIDKATNTLLSEKDKDWSYFADYAKGNYYSKMTKLVGPIDADGKAISEEKTSLGEALITYFGEQLGNEIITKQTAILNAAKNKPMLFVLEDQKTQESRQLTLGVDNSLVWDFATQKKEGRNIAGALGEKPYNPRAEAILRSDVLSTFYKWLDDHHQDNAIIKAYPNIKQIVDAAIAPCSNKEYIENYILPNWTVNVVQPDGSVDNISHPIVLPSYTYDLVKTNQKTGAQSVTRSAPRKIQFSVADLMKWDGDDYYVKDMSPNTGSLQTYYFQSPGGKKETDYRCWHYNDTPEGKAAEEKWRKKMTELVKNAIEPLNSSRSDVINDCHILFNEFLQTSYNAKSLKEIEYAWNKKFNGYVMPNSEHYPIFCVHRKYFAYNRTKGFSFQQAQRQGIRQAVSRNNSVVLAHEVGFGKTTSALGYISHLFETGEANRILLCVPQIVYDKWIREAHGANTKEGYFIGLTPQINIVGLNNAYPESLKALKDYTQDDIYAMKMFKSFKKRYEQWTAMQRGRKISHETNKPEEIIDLLTYFLPTYANFKSLVEFADEIKWSFSYTKREFKRKLEEINKDIERTKIRLENAYVRKDESIKERINVLGHLIDDLMYKKNNSSDKKEIIKINKEIKDKAEELKERKKSLKEIKLQYEAKAKKIEEVEAPAKIDAAKREFNALLTSLCNNVVDLREQWLVDDLGNYKPYVLRNKTVVICTHQALDKLRPELKSGFEAISIIDDAFDEATDFKYDGVKYNSEDRQELIQRFIASGVGSSSTKIADYAKPYNMPVSLEKLNIDSFVVDEVHEFNNITINSRKRNVYRDANANPTGMVKGSGSLSQTQLAFHYFTKNSGQRKKSSVNCLAVARSIQNANRSRGKNNNTLLLSATPFTDSPIFQMTSVFSILSYELLMENGIKGVFDVFNQYATEEWKPDLNYKGQLELLPLVEKYKNIYANSNLLKLFVHFKIEDEDIVKLRPQKYTIPILDDNKELINIVGEKINSYVTMNQYQVEAKKRLLDFLHGEITFDSIFEPRKQQEIVLLPIGSEDEMYKMADIVNGQVIRRTDLTPNAYFVAEIVDDVVSWTNIGTDLNAVIEAGYLKSAPKKVKADSDDEEDIQAESVDAESSFIAGAMTQKDMLKARAILSMTTDQNLSTSPYMSGIKNLNLPPLVTYDETGRATYYPERFVENSPKLIYIAECIKSVIDHHKTTGLPLSSQIVFLNRQQFEYPPKKDAPKYDPLEMFKQYLAQRPDIDINENEIAIISGKTSQKTRATIAEDYNRGVYKVLLGTAAIQQGVDLQVNTSVMYIAQASYVPSMLMQVEGRAWRQGNKWKNIRMIYVMTYNSLDVFQLTRVDHKIRQIKSMFAKNEILDMNETQFKIDYNEMKLELELDINKKRDLKYRIESDEMKKKKALYQAEYGIYQTLIEKAPNYKEKYEKFISRVNRLGAMFEAICLKYAKYPLLERYKKRQKKSRLAEIRKEFDEKKALLEQQNREAKEAYIQDKVTPLRESLKAEKENDKALEDKIKALGKEIKDLEKQLAKTAEDDKKLEIQGKINALIDSTEVEKRNVAATEVLIKSLEAQIEDLVKKYEPLVKEDVFEKLKNDKQDKIKELDSEYDNVSIDVITDQDVINYIEGKETLEEEWTVSTLDNIPDLYDRGKLSHIKNGKSYREFRIYKSISSEAISGYTVHYHLLPDGSNGNYARVTDKDLSGQLINKYLAAVKEKHDAEDFEPTVAVNTSGWSVTPYLNTVELRYTPALGNTQLWGKERQYFSKGTDNIWYDSYKGENVTGLTLSPYGSPLVEELDNITAEIQKRKNTGHQYNIFESVSSGISTEDDTEIRNSYKHIPLFLNSSYSTLMEVYGNLIKFSEPAYKYSGYYGGATMKSKKYAEILEAFKDVGYDVEKKKEKVLNFIRDTFYDTFGKRPDGTDVVPKEAVQIDNTGRIVYDPSLYWMDEDIIDPITKKVTGTQKVLARTFGSGEKIVISPYKLFWMDFDGYKHNSLRGGVIKSFISMGGDMAEIKKQLDSAHDKLGGVLAQEANEKKIKAEIYKKLLEEQEKKKLEGAFIMEEQVKKFEKTNILIELK